MKLKNFPLIARLRPLRIRFSLLLPLFFPLILQAQDLQFHEDLRHTTDPTHNPKNYPTIYFQYFKAQDSGTHFVKPGSFLLKTQADLLGQKNNIGKFYIQVGQSFRCWQPKIFLALQYSAGLGVTEPKQYSYYINNTYSAGLQFPFHWKNTWFSMELYYRYTPYKRPSHDPLFTFYWWKGLLHYKLELAGDFSTWMENKDHGDGDLPGATGKNWFFYAEPQIWYDLGKTLAIGSKINTYYHVNTPANLLQVYPTLAIKCKL